LLPLRFLFALTLFEGPCNFVHAAAPRFDALSTMVCPAVRRLKLLRLGGILDEELQL